MDIKEKELKLKKQAILDLSEQIAILRLQAERTKEKMDNLKEEVRGILQDTGITFIKNDKWKVSISYPATVDPGMLKMKYKPLYQRFVTKERVSNTVEKVAKNCKDILKAEYPDAYIDAVAQGTPRLRITNIEAE